MAHSPLTVTCPPNMVSGLVDGMRGIRAWKILIRIPPLLMHIAHIIPNACQARVFNC